MTYYLIKLIVTSVLIVAISEVSKHSSLLGAVLASVPLVSVLAMIWLYLDTGSTERVVALTTGILWLILPSLILFVSLPILLRHGVNFFLALSASTILTAAGYFLMLHILARFNVEV